MRRSIFRLDLTDWEAADVTCHGAAILPLTGHDEYFVIFDVDINNEDVVFMERTN